MSDQITYEDKADLIVDTTIDDMFKVSASDMNELKNVVNSHADDIDVANNNITDLNNNKLDINEVLNEASTDTDKPYSANYLNDKLVSVGETAPENGERVWFSKSKNLFDEIWEQGNINANTGENEGTSSSIRRSVNYIPVEPNTTYTISRTINGNSMPIREYGNDKSFIGTQSPLSSQAYSSTFTIPSNVYYIRIVDFVNNNTNQIMVAEGSTIAEYEPYIEPKIYVDEEEWYSKPKVLYDNSAGATTGTITLNESIENYSYIEVEYTLKDFNNNIRNVQKFAKSTATKLIGDICTAQLDGSSNLRIFTANITINDNSLVLARSSTVYVLATSGITTQTSNVAITKILGYK